MALLDIKCTPETLAKYFGRQSSNYLNVTAFMNDSKIKANRKLMKKYMVEKNSNETIFDNLRFSTTRRILNAETIIFDSHTRDLFFSLNLNDKTIQVLHQNPITAKKQNIDVYLVQEILKGIEKAQRIKGIGLNERKDLSELHQFFNIHDFQYKWISDIQFIYSTNIKGKHTMEDGASCVKLFHQEKNKIFVLYVCSLHYLLKLKNYRVHSTWTPLNKKKISKLPMVIRRGDKIIRILECENFTLIEKETGVIWEIEN